LVTTANYVPIDANVADVFVVPWSFQEAAAAKAKYARWPRFIQDLLLGKYTPQPGIATG
jgi:hypothetical protein